MGKPTSLIGILITAYALYATMGSVKSIFFGMIVVDPFSHMLKWIILLTTFANVPALLTNFPPSPGLISIL